MIDQTWIDDTNDRLARGQIVWPESIEQLDWLVEHHPQYALRVLPPRSEMQFLNRPCAYGRMRSFGDEWQERFLLTAVENPDFAPALRVVLIGGVV
ncbi:hypothetical protein GC176_10225 [bacterium]|nr:hypothetical protein [bacterium]